MKLNIVVLAKQVPDTRNVGPDAMTTEGTVNRSALPAIFNPEDLNALEQALRLKVSLQVYVNIADAEVEKQFNWIRKMTPDKVDYYRQA